MPFRSPCWYLMKASGLSTLGSTHQPFSNLPLLGSTTAVSEAHLRSMTFSSKVGFIPPQAWGSSPSTSVSEGLVSKSCNLGSGEEPSGTAKSRSAACGRQPETLQSRGPGPVGRVREPLSSLSAPVPQDLACESPAPGSHLFHSCSGHRPPLGT